MGGHPDEFKWILDRLGPKVAVCLDTSHSTLGHHWRRFVEVAGERVEHVHASDHHGHRDDQGHGVVGLVPELHGLCQPHPRQPGAVDGLGGARVREREPGGHHDVGPVLVHAVDHRLGVRGSGHAGGLQEPAGRADGVLPARGPMVQGDGGRIDQVTRIEGHRHYVLSYDAAPQDQFLATPAKYGGRFPHELVEPE